MLKSFPADLHIHTCLSPCADEEMNPINILNMAKLLGTKIIGICDHNTAGNIEAIKQASEGYDILVLCGMEVESVEEVHMLCFFENVETITKWQSFIYDHLPNRKNDANIFGRQQLVDKDGNVIGEEERLLLTSTNLSVNEISEKATEMGGLVIPAHIDRKSYSLLGQLGFIPEDLKVNALEFSRNASDFQRESILRLLNKEYAIITSSDAHRLQEMVFQKTFFYLKTPSFTEVSMAFRCVGGRKVEIID